jgi:hypothetical protein
MKTNSEIKIQKYSPVKVGLLTRSYLKPIVFVNKILSVIKHHITNLLSSNSREYIFSLPSYFITHSIPA